MMVIISVIIPVHNSEKYLTHTLNSVLSQTFTNFEIICVNDGSVDKSAEILDCYVKKDNRIHVITQKNAGVVTARNKGIESAIGKYIYTLDSDDIIDKTLLEKSYKAITSGMGDVITCRVAMFGEETGEMKLSKPSKFNLSHGNCLVNAALFKKEDFLKSGGFDKAFDAGLEDWDFWLNMVYNENCKIYRLPEILFYYRIKSAQESRNKQQKQNFNVRLEKLIRNKYPQTSFYEWIHKKYKYIFQIRHKDSKDLYRFFRMPLFSVNFYQNCTVYKMFDIIPFFINGKRFYHCYKNTSINKVAFLLPHIIMGGVEKVLIEVLKELKKQKKDWKFSVYTKQKVTDEYFINFFKHENIPLKDYWFLHKPKKLMAKIGYKIVNPFYKFWAPKFLKYSLSQNDILVDFQYFSFGKEIADICLPKVTWFHGSINHFNLHFNENTVEYINKYDKLVCLTHSFEDDFKNQYPQYADKIECIYNSLNYEEIREKAIVDTSKGKYFCLVSRLDEEKDIKTVISAFKIFAIKHNDAKLLIAGEGPLKEELIIQANDCRGILFLGKINEPYTLIKNSIASILSSYSEGLPVILLENMALGTLSISSKCKSGPPEVLMDGKLGLLFEPGNVEQLAKIMENVWNGNVATEEMITQATKNLYRFSTANNTKSIIKLIESLHN